MDGNIQKALWLGVSILLFLAVVAIGMSVFQNVRGGTTDAMENVNATNQQLNNAKYSLYDNQEVSGTDVISAINNYKLQSGEIQIVVTNSSGTATTYISGGTASTGALTELTLAVIDGTIQASQNKSATTTYINPYGSFYATLIYDVNKEVRGMNFVQQ